MRENILGALLGASFFFNLISALLIDALRFASSGHLMAKLEKKYKGNAKLEIMKKRMDRYFEEDGHNLRELDWLSHMSMIALVFLGLLFFSEKADAELTVEQLLKGKFPYFILCVFTWNYFLVRSMTEPFAEAVLIRLYPLWRIMHMVAYPLSLILNRLQMLITRVAGLEPEKTPESEQRVLDSMEDGERSGVLLESEREMIENIIELKDLTVEEIMTPRTEMAALSLETSIEQVVEMMIKERYSRILVFEGNRDHVIGFIHTRDLLPYWRKLDEAPPLVDLIHKPYFVPETKKIRDLLQEFQKEHIHIAIVLDEYGGTSGLVTIEDALEEIVGSIVDEHQDDEEALFVAISENEARVNAKLRITDLCDQFGIQLEEDTGYDSVGGLLISSLGRIPAEGEQGKLSGIPLHYKIISANERKIEVVQLSKVADEKA
ncbi:MAG: HlyC/CorC family transporter [Planctomycetes bacterium]|nr:HlyC/CorC family transporter [Planctomycetota bacterium]